MMYFDMHEHTALIDFGLYCRFSNLKAMILHLNKTHDEEVKLETLKFDDIQVFNLWKKGIEDATNSHYVQHSSSNCTGNERNWYYYCNRAGTYKPRGKGNRQLKLQGTSKIGKQCSAHIKATQKQCGEVSVHYCGFHTHSTSIGHLPISNSVRETIACKLKDGVKLDNILDDIRDKIAGIFKREHLITKQDIQNIKRQYNIHGVQRHKDDQLSVSAWVVELQSLDYNPIVAFKPQGLECDSIAKDDFVLAIQTKFQCDMMKEYGCLLICMDATHGTNHYDFKLVTVIVLDDHGEGVPVGWMISNREDGKTLSYFLQLLKTRTGDIIAESFMSDDAEQYYSAWNSTYGGNPQKLLCSWHVDKAWRVNLKSLITSKQKQLEAYQQVRTAMETINTVEFTKLLQQIISWMLSDEELVKFAEYFKTWYCKRVKEWAFCFRVGTPANTNMAVEAFHRYLKIVYLEGKHNRRVDNLLSILLRIARDRVYDRAIKLEKGKLTHRVCEITKRHHRAVEMKEKRGPGTVIEDGNGLWRVPSASRDGTVYTVTAEYTNCDCKLCCGFCGACIHRFSCSCVDSAVHSTVCKHSHLVQMHIFAQPGTAEAHPSTSSSESDVQSLHYLAQVLPTSASQNTIETVKQELRSLLNEIQTFSDSTVNADVVKSGIVHLRSGLATMKAVEHTTHDLQTIAIREQVAPNKNHALQPRFKSTRKRRRSDVHFSLTKPSASEIDTCKSKMMDIEIKVCAICFGEEDGKGSDETVLWIACTRCETWVHLACVAARPSTSSCSGDYTCDNCV